MFFVTCKRRRLLHGYCLKAKSSLLRANPWHRALGTAQPGGAQQPCTPGEGRSQPTPLQTHTEGVAGAGEQAQAPRSNPSAAVPSVALQKLLQTPNQQGLGSTRSFTGSLLGTGEPEVVQGRVCRVQTTLENRDPYPFHGHCRLHLGGHSIHAGSHAEPVEPLVLLADGILRVDTSTFHVLLLKGLEEQRTAAGTKNPPCAHEPAQSIPP